MKRTCKQDRKDSFYESQRLASKRVEHSPISSHSDEESTKCMFSGKKRRRTTSKSAPKQRYLKSSASNHLNFDNYSPAVAPKSKKQYWTEDEVRIHCFPTHLFLSQPF